MKRFLFLVLVLFWAVPAQAVEVLKSSETATCADSGDGNPGAVTITIDEGNAIYAVALTVSDADGCNVTIEETNAVDGFMLIITNVSAANTATITTSANAYELEQGSPYVMGADDNVMFIYRSSKWLELGRTGALAGTFGGFSTTAGTAVVSSSTGTLSQAETLFIMDIDDEDLKFTKTGANGVTMGTNSGVTDLTTAINLVSTGTISGKIPMITKADDYTLGTDNAQEAYGYIIWMSGANKTLTLPAVVAGMSGCLYSTDAEIKRLDPNASDGLRMGAARDTDGDAIAATAAIGAYVCWVADGADGWTILGKNGTWTAE